MQIRDVETLVGISKKNIRFYEKEGLLSPARNLDNSYRQYSEEDVLWLKKIKLFRKLGLPLEEIRLLRNGGRSFSQLIERQSRVLAHERRNCEYRQQVCDDLLALHGEPDSNTVEEYLARIEDFEREGVSFVDIGRQDTVKKYLGATIPAVLFAAVLFSLLILFIVDFSATEMPPFIFWLFVCILGVFIISIFAAMLQRYKEIKEGEEDDARKY